MIRRFGFIYWLLLALVFLLVLLWVLFVMFLGEAEPPPREEPALPLVEPWPAPQLKEKPKFVRSIFGWPQESRYERPHLQVPDVSAIAESPKGELLAWGDEEGNVFLSHAKGRQPEVVKNTTLHSRPTLKEEVGYYKTLSLRFQRDGELLWLDGGGTAWRAGLKDGKPVSKRRVNEEPVLGFSGAILQDSFVMSVDKNTYRKSFLQFVPSTTYVLAKHDLKTGRFQETCKIYRRGTGYHWVNEMAISPDNKLLAIASECNAGIVQLTPFKFLRSFHVTFGKSLAFSPDSSHVAVGRLRQVLVYETETGKLIREVKMGRADIARPLAFSSNNTLWFGYTDALYRLDVDKGEIKLALAGLGPKVMLVSKDWRHLYIGTRLGTVDIYELPADEGSELLKEGAKETPSSKKPQMNSSNKAPGFRTCFYIIFSMSDNLRLGTWRVPEESL